MTLPPAVESIWRELEAVRTEVRREAEGLSSAQAAWRPDGRDWSVAEILHHLALAEVATGKLSTKLLREAGERLAPFPADLAAFRPLPPWPPGPREAPPVVRPETGHDPDQLLRDLAAARQRSRQTLERVGTIDPRPLTFPHFLLGPLDLAQWWMLQVRHESEHLEQLRRLKATPGFPRG